jgi:ribosomal protein L37AE/L43A
MSRGFFLAVAEVLSLYRHGLLVWVARREGVCREGSVSRTSANQCAQCGTGLIAPQWSEDFPDNRIRNVWSCDTCGYEFEDTVYWRARELVDAE